MLARFIYRLSLNMPPDLSAREVCQRLRDAALGVCALRRLDDVGHVSIDIEGWRLVLDFDGLRLLHCFECRCANGRQWSLDASPFGTDPVSLLSTWELARIEGLLAQCN